MRILKLLATLVPLTILAWAIAAPASATKTALCKVHQEPCQAGNLVTDLHMLAVGNVYLLNTEADILCLNGLIKGKVDALEAPQGVQVSEYTLTNCGTNAAHSNCTVTFPVRPNFFILKTALNLGQLSETGHSMRIECTLFGILVKCTYKFSEGIRTFIVEGAQHKGAGTGHGMLTYPPPGEEEEGEVELEEGTALCPDTFQYEGLFEPLTDFWVVS